MEDSTFHEMADILLEGLMEAIETADENGTIDVEYISGVLTIKLPDGNEYVINKHEPTKQIWVSSPFSGAAKFSYNEDEDEWMPKSGRHFRDFISIEFDKNLNLDVEF
jgi:frataxin